MENKLEKILAVIKSIQEDNFYIYDRHEQIGDKIESDKDLARLGILHTVIRLFESEEFLNDMTRILLIDNEKYKTDVEEDAEDDEIKENNEKK